MGHGTAVPGHFDIDLVIYSRGIRGRIFLAECMLINIQPFMVRHRWKCSAPTAKFIPTMAKEATWLP